MRRVQMAATFAVGALLLAGCGGGEPASGDVMAGDAARCAAEAADCVDPNSVVSNADPGSMAMCAEGVTDCNDMVVVPDGETQDDEVTRQMAVDLLGTPEQDLPPDVRIGRRGPESMALTEDYNIGRLTAELDADDAGVFRVTSVVAELESGPTTVTDAG